MEQSRATSMLLARLLLRIALLVCAGLVILQLPSMGWARPGQATVSGARGLATPATPGRRMLQLWREARGAQPVGQPGRRVGSGTLARIKGQTYTEFPALLKRHRTLTKRQRDENADPTFRGTHPMFQRLVRSGWYGQTARIARLQALADNLRQTRAIDGQRPLSQVEVLAFDLEATAGSCGRFDKRRQRHLSGWDEVAQFGYTIYRGGQKVRSGTIAIRPDASLSDWVQRNAGLTPRALAGAPRFEQVAGQILELMQGRVLVGQSAIKKDWGWLRSNFARLGVTLPGPERLILDTHLLSFNHFAAGAGLKDLARHFRVRQSNHHNARYDAQATGDVFFAMMRHAPAGRSQVSPPVTRSVTLDQAFALQQRGYEQMKQPRVSGK